MNKYYKLVITNDQNTVTVSEDNLTTDQYLNLEACLFNNRINYTVTIANTFEEGQTYLYYTITIDFDKVGTIITALL